MLPLYSSTKPNRFWRAYLDIICAVNQVSFPATTDSIINIGWKEKFNRSEPISMARYLLAHPAIDYLSWQILPAVNHNPLELVAWRLAANAITHVSVDLGDAAIKRIKNFRPSATTL